MALLAPEARMVLMGLTLLTELLVVLLLAPKQVKQPQVAVGVLRQLTLTLEQPGQAELLLGVTQIQPEVVQELLV